MFTIDGLGREDPQQHVRFVQMWLNDDQVGHLAHVAAGKTALADDVAVAYRWV